jgi:hypothetical protein
MKLIKFKYLLVLIFIFMTDKAFANCPDIEGITVSSSFGVSICAMPGVDQKFLDHATSVMDKLLDYDEDGLVDNNDVLQTLISSGSVYAIFRKDREIEDFLESYYGEDNYELIEEYCNKVRDEAECEIYVDSFGTMLSVFVNEMNLSGKGWDPTIEEALHLITHGGYAQFYPDIFGQHKDSYIAKLMDNARGGYFEKSQKRYPNGAYYTYNDRSCSYSCQITEFTFWAITSLRGQQANRGNEISHEWKLNTPEKLKDRDPDLLAFLTDPKYAIKF